MGISNFSGQGDIVSAIGYRSYSWRSLKLNTIWVNIVDIGYQVVGSISDFEPNEDERYCFVKFNLHSPKEVPMYLCYAEVKEDRVDLFCCNNLRDAIDRENGELIATAEISENHILEKIKRKLGWEPE